MKTQDIKEIIDMNLKLLTIMGYMTSIIFELESLCEPPKRTQEQILWFKTAIENVVYKNIPAPRMP